MGRARQTKRFATMKRMMSASDPRLKDKDRAPPRKKKAEDPNKTTGSLAFWFVGILGLDNSCHNCD